MKKLSLSLVFTIASVFSFAQITGNGYYRVRNMATNYYVHVEDNTGSINIGKGSADMGAILLWDGFDNSVSDPGSVLYFEKHGNLWDIQSQGTGIYDLISRYVELTSRNTNPTTYELSASASGIIVYLFDGGKPASYSDYHILSTSDAGVKYRRWYADPITSDGDNYFGIKPKFQLKGKYYSPFYANFPFSFSSSGMKAYTISKVDGSIAVLKEIKDSVIPGKTPVIIECSSDKPSANRLNLLTGKYPSISSNVLSGVFFCHDQRAKSKDARTPFNESTMRVLGVKNGKLVFNNDKNSQHKSLSKDDDGNVLTSYYLNPNECYLNVSNGTVSELTIMTEEEYEASKPKVYTFNVKGENGSVSLDPAHADSKYEEGTGVTVTAIPNEGYSFEKWSDGSLQNPYSYTIKENATLEAYFTKNSYKVTFMADGQVLSEYKVEYDDSIPTENAPDKEGHTFIGWSGDTYDKMPAFDLYYSAQYSVNQYKVYYYSDNELVHEETVEYGSTIPDFTVSKDGFNFAGWVGKDTYMPAHDVTLNALFVEKDKRTVSVESLHGNVSITPAAENNVYVVGTTITISVTPEEGFEFNSWSNGSTENPLSITLTEDLKLSAIFTPKNYTVSYYDGETLIGTQSVACGSAIPEYEAPAKEGYTFYAWNGEAFDAMPAKDIKYTAIYTVNSYKVMYYVDDELVNTVSVVYGDPIPVYEYKKEGWIFKGWDGEEATTMPARDLQYTAIFEADAIVPTFVKGNAVNVYTITGTCVKRNVTAEDIKSLPTGLYIINGKKVVIR